jgi:hypothetical protein
VDEVGDEKVLDARAVPANLLALKDLGEVRCGARDLGLAIPDRRSRCVNNLEVRLADGGEPEFPVNPDFTEAEILARGH